MVRKNARLKATQNKIALPILKLGELVIIYELTKVSSQDFHPTTYQPSLRNVAFVENSSVLLRLVVEGGVDFTEQRSLPPKQTSPPTAVGITSGSKRSTITCVMVLEYSR